MRKKNVNNDNFSNEMDKVFGYNNSFSDLGDDNSPIITNHKKRRKTNNIKKEIPFNRIQNIFADESDKNKEVKKSSKSRSMFSVLSGIFIFCLVVVFVFSMIVNIEIPGTESKKIDLDSIKLQDGVKKIADNESVKPLTDVFSPISENEKQTTDFYVNQKGKNFIFSNGYELETKNLTELDKAETIKVEPYDDSYGGTEYFFSAYSDNALKNIYLGYTSYLNNNIADSYEIQNGENAKLYKVFPAEKFNGYEVAYIYIMDIQDNYSINHINKIYRLPSGSGFYIDCSFDFDGDEELETNKEGNLYEFDWKKFDQVKGIIDNQFVFKKTN